ncbi:sterigmatocystin biosynthesis monooxygenase stcW [Fusarium albosuccineum]|uniref:Sterigmatocystin biosynthesis monooxygenase stcW n=1 Tax=Fusarium albosuccineum TaxID=1237068 RepID=A0A8H4PKH7_9HYPO|nr:sterigmatocystin biosynthesis monooxygenase stcW [Fusarium albosuccineum]
MDPLKEDAIHHERFVKIACVGAGVSGLCLAYKLRRSFENYSLTIYEKNPQVGGTWFENVYPGCACDVPSHNYTYSFEPKADFSSVLASSEEIKDYFEGFAVKYDLLKHVKTQHLITETSWDPLKGQWSITATDLQSQTTVHDWCHILVHATGYLNKPAWPSVPGLEKFQGAKLHSAQWDNNVSLEGKDVLLIGSGASSAQILPAIQSKVKSVKVFVRTPRWTLPSVNSKRGKFLPEEIERFINDPQAVTNLRLENERTLNSFFTMYMKGTVLQKQAREHLESEMKKVVLDPEIQKRLVPEFPVGCKRILPSGDQFLYAIRENNVHVVYSGVKSFTETGCISDDGQSHQGDVIISATGFDTSFVPRYPVLFKGHNLQEDWSTSITGYMGVGISECPNSFTLAGPWTPISNGPVIVAIESQTDFVCAFIDKYQTEPGMRSMSLKAAACYDFKAYVAQVTKKMVWSDNCRNSHNVRSNWGQPSITWPGSTLHYLEAIREPRFEDYEFEYSGNRFAWMGNGLSQTEWDPTADLAYYIRTSDDGRQLSRRARLKSISKSGTQPERELHRQAKLSTA